MAFYRPDEGMVSILEALIERLELEGRPGLGDQLSITWLRYEGSLIDRGAALEPAAFWGLPVLGASWGGSRQRYPASVVKLVYMVAVEAWLQQQWLEEGPELRRAMADMIRDSSNDATGLLVDLLSGTTSGPDLLAPRLAAWSAQRQLVNGWLAELGWPEFEACNACQKTWGDGPFGRERQFYGEDLENRNRLSTDATARLLHGVIAGALVSPPACVRMRALLSRSLDPVARRADPENQVDGFLGEALEQGSRLWSKAGWMSQARHDAAYVEAEGQAPFLLVVFSEGADRAADGALLPSIARALGQVTAT
ncbi:serine hydrolase [Cyanobium sp. ATX 6F1]|uniref:serine hydrolase n=1 Tax=unclassified Cyanobium TaxID=2627006 RepID=UPI0020CD7B72|nr:serine hydrolase [Cyanobium sp. ATX 6F1]MCP9917293.1 serine hydrolase [Cyanobium sp. ATX 6F1]